MLAGQAARIRGNTLEVKGQLLRELLTQSNAFGYLMGSGGPGGEAGQLLQQPHSQPLTCFGVREIPSVAIATILAVIKAAV